MTPAMSRAGVVSSLPAEQRAKVRESGWPGWFSPMLAKLTDERFSRGGWLFEPKLDGERCLVHCRDSRIELFSRNHKPLNSKYPEIVEAFDGEQAESLIVDGEVVALVDGVSSFAALQQRMQIQHPSTELQRRVPVWFYAFDLLYLDGYDLRKLPLRYRRRLLENSLAFRNALRLTECRERDGEAYYEEACERHWEGVIAKDAGSVYVSDRSRYWLKFKCVNEAEFVIGGYTDPAGRRIGFGALLVGYYERGKLKYAGKVGTGYDAETLERLGQRLAVLRSGRSPFEEDGLPRAHVHWVTPKLVAQIGFAEWTSEGKLRHPRFLGLREDKAAEEVTRGT